jgi:hypothetical protein
MQGVTGISYNLNGMGGRIRGCMSGTAQLETAIRKRLAPETKQYLNHINVMPSKHYIMALDDLIHGLKDDGNWQLLDRLWIFATEHKDNAQVSIVNPWSTRITEVNNPTWTKLLGYQGDGSSSYLNSNFNPYTQAVNYKTSNASFGVYSQSNVAANGNVDIGGVDSSGIRAIYQDSQNALGQVSVNINDNGGEFAAISNSLSLICTQRISSNTIYTYQRGLRFGTISYTVAGIPNIIVNILSYNNDGSPSLFGTRAVSLVYLGGAMDQFLFYHRIQTFATKIGFNV